MVKKRKSAASKAFGKPWCWYCDRDFDDEKVLIQHQKAKHFKCSTCSRKLNTANGMVIHCMQVHKETVTTVTNAKPGKESVEIEIFGMEGIPEEDVIAKAAERGENKRPKVEAASLPNVPLGFPGMAPGPPGFMPGMPSMPPHLQGFSGFPPGMMGMNGFPMMPPGFMPPPGFPMPPGMQGMQGMQGMPPGMNGMPPFMGPGMGFMPSGGSPGMHPGPPAAFPAYQPGAAFPAYQPGASVAGSEEIGPKQPIESTLETVEEEEPEPKLPVDFRKRLAEGFVLVFGVEDQSIEELRASQSKYRYKKKIQS